MQKVCKENMDNHKVYNSKTLFIITVIFMFFGFIILSTYRLWLMRYAFILILLAIVFIKRKKFKSVFKEIQKK